MSEKNPLYESDVKKTEYFVDFEVICVIGLGDESKEEIQEAKEICQERGIQFRRRGFDSEKYEHDAEMIPSLPYFYLSKKRSYYPYEAVKPSEIIEKIKRECLRCKEYLLQKKMQEEERRQQWNNFFSWFSKSKKSPASSLSKS